MSKPAQAYKNFVSQLNTVGLNLCASFLIDELPESVKKSLPADYQASYYSLLLVATKGGRFWEYINSTREKFDHPFDQLSQQVTEKLINKHYPGIKTLAVYPGSDYVIPLQQLGHLVGWGRPSILGLDIHPQYGTWFAYRTALLVSEQLPETQRVQADAACEVCVEKPCRTACPVNAVENVGTFNIKACGAHRISPDSACASQCLARLACPVGQDYRYHSDQLAHHSSFSLASIKRYMGNN